MIRTSGWLRRLFRSSARAPRGRLQLWLEPLEKRELLAQSGLLASASAAAPFVEGLYRKLLDREAQPAELAGWQQALAQGTLGTQVVESFVTSAEYGARIVSDDYGRLLGRQPEASALAGWIEAGQASGTWNTVTVGLVTSSEYLACHPSRNPRHFLCLID